MKCVRNPEKWLGPPFVYFLILHNDEIGTKQFTAKASLVYYSTMQLWRRSENKIIQALRKGRIIAAPKPPRLVIIIGLWHFYK